jgi:hypothetical protein
LLYLNGELGFAQTPRQDRPRHRDTATPGCAQSADKDTGSLDFLSSAHLCGAFNPQFELSSFLFIHRVGTMK